MGMTHLTLPDTPRIIVLISKDELSALVKWHMAKSDEKVGLEHIMHANRANELINIQIPTAQGDTS